MKYVYLVCSRKTWFDKVRLSIEPFTQSEISKLIEKLRLSPSPFLFNILQCCSSERKAIDLCNRFNGIDEYRFYQSFHKDYRGRITRIGLDVYYYYIVVRLLI